MWSAIVPVVHKSNPQGRVVSRTHPGVVGEQLPCVLIVDQLLCEPVAKAHGEGTLHLTNVNFWIDAIWSGEKSIRSI